MLVQSCVLILLAASLNAEYLGTPFAEKPLRWIRAPSTSAIQRNSKHLSKTPSNSPSDTQDQANKLKEANEASELKGDNEDYLIYPAERTHQKNPKTQLRTKQTFQFSTDANKNSPTGKANQLASSPRVYPQPAAALHYSTQAGVNQPRSRSGRPFVERNGGVDANNDGEPLKQTEKIAPVMSLRKNKKRFDCKMCRRKQDAACNKANG